VLGFTEGWDFPRAGLGEVEVPPTDFQDQHGKKNQNGAMTIILALQGAESKQCSEVWQPSRQGNAIQLLSVY
jgi:hypothetical protein